MPTFFCSFTDLTYHTYPFDVAGVQHGKWVIPFTGWAFKLIPKTLNWLFTICSTTSNCPFLQGIWKEVFYCAFISYFSEKNFLDKLKFKKTKAGCKTWILRRWKKNQWAEETFKFIFDEKWLNMTSSFKNRTLQTLCSSILLQFLFFLLVNGISRLLECQAKGQKCLNVAVDLKQCAKWWPRAAAKKFATRTTWCPFGTLHRLVGPTLKGPQGKLLLICAVSFKQRFLSAFV